VWSVSSPDCAASAVEAFGGLMYLIAAVFLWKLVKG
jgi:hypothetical protein